MFRTTIISKRIKKIIQSLAIGLPFFLLTSVSFAADGDDYLANTGALSKVLSNFGIGSNFYWIVIAGCVCWAIWEFIHSKGQLGSLVKPVIVLVAFAVFFGMIPSQ